MENAIALLKKNFEDHLSNLDVSEWISFIFLVLDQNELIAYGFRYSLYVIDGRKKVILLALQRILESRGYEGIIPQNIYYPVLQAMYLIGRHDILIESLGFCAEHSLHQNLEKIEALPPERVAMFQCFQGITQEQADHLLQVRLASWNQSVKNTPLELSFCRNLSPGNYFDLLCDLHDAFEFEGLVHMSTMLKPHIKKSQKLTENIENFCSTMSVDLDSMYPLPQHHPHGLCLIINVKNYLAPQSPDDRIPLDVRRGSDIDQQRLEGTFKLFGFNVIHLEDPGFEELCNCFANIRTDERLYSIACLAVCIMTHGDDDDNLYLYDRTCIPISDIRKLCYGQALIGKPRLYFVQACRGDQNLRPVFLQRDTTTTSNSEGDCLISTATVKGYSAMRSQSSGSWYITDLCSSLQEYGHSHPLKTVLMKTRDKLQKRVDKYAGGYVTQISEDKSTLIKDVQLVRSDGNSFYDGLADLVMLEVIEDLMDWGVDEFVSELDIAA